MISWWGPVLYEYYAGTEGNGFVACNSTDWLAHRGTVGRALVGEIRILDEAGKVLPPGETGTIYFANGRAFEYHNDPTKTAELIAHCRANLSHIKCPRSVDFEAELPRSPTGKLYKRLLRDRYWEAKA